MLFLFNKTFYKKNYQIIIILFFAFFLRLVFLDTSYIFWDESIYLMGGRILAGQQAGYNELDFRHPLLTVMIAPFALSDHYLYLSKTFMILLNTFFVFIVYVFAKQFNKRIGLLSAFLVSIWPYHLMSSSWVMTDGLAAILLLSTILFYFKGFKQNKNSLIRWGGFFLGLAVLAKLTNLILLILLLPLIIFNLEKIQVILKSFLIFFLTLLPYFVINYLNFSHPLYGVLKAFRISNVMLSTVGVQPVGTVFKVFYDFFGIVISILLFAGVLLFTKKEVISQKDKKIRRENLFWIYCLIIFLSYYVYTVHEGATPVWWDAQRFLLSFLPLGLIFSTYFATEVTKNFSNKPKLIILTALIVLIMISWGQQYTRFKQPAISYEEGLRYVTKEMGLYLKDQNIDQILCLGNCPPVAYYSNKKTLIVYNYEDFKLMPNQQGVIFSDNIKKIGRGYSKIKTFCKYQWCVYLIKMWDNRKKISVENLDLEEKIGQMIITTLPSSSSKIRLDDLFNDYNIGGIIYMAWPNDIENMTEEQIASLSDNLQKKSEIPLFIAADIEGGEINRLHSFLKISTNQEYGREYEFVEDKKYFLENYKNDIQKIANILLSTGINLNLAPVLDVEQILENGVLSKQGRSYSENYPTVSDLGSTYIIEMEKKGILTTAKHFPGHGHTDCDTYLENCEINVSKEYLESNDILPFKSAIQNGVSFVMVGLFRTPYDKKNIGITSYFVVTGLLRDRLNYKGVVITDDFMMGATKNLSRKQLATDAILAGNDIILTTNPDDVPLVFDSLLSAVEKGEISEKRINESLARILEAKKRILLQ